METKRRNHFRVERDRINDLLRVVIRPVFYIDVRPNRRLDYFDRNKLHTGSETAAPQYIARHA